MKALVKKISIVLLAVVVATGCEEFLEEDLRDQIAVEEFFNNDAEALLAINGLYRIIHRNGLYNVQGGLDEYYANGADEVGPSRNVNAQIHNYLIDEGVADGNAIWAALYELIRNSNLAIENIEGNENLSDAVRDQTLGEALFMRSLAYFHLTNLWGDVPYFRENLGLTELGSLGRADEDMIRSEVKQDLARAAELLPGSYSDSELGRASKWAALTLKAKMHLFDEEWALAFEESLKVINESPHRLLDNYADVHDQSDINNQYNDEIIFAVDFTKDAIFGDGSTRRTDNFNPRIRDEPKNAEDKQALREALMERNEAMTGYGWSVPLPELADKSNWEEGDLRYEATIVKEYLGIELTHPYFRKMWNLDQEDSPRGNHPENYVVFRLADVYLMAAEAANEHEGPGAAYEYVNAVRERAFEPEKPWLGMSQQEFREAMYDERKFELAAEGHRRMDLIRWGVLVETVKNTEHRAWNNPADNIMPYHVLLPIPLEEIRLNPNLLESDPTNNGYR